MKSKINWFDVILWAVVLTGLIGTWLMLASAFGVLMLETDIKL